MNKPRIVKAKDWYKERDRAPSEERSKSQSESRSESLGVREALPARTDRQHNNQIFPVAMRYGVTPVPIPNTTVKTISAEGTVLETIRENRWLPDPLRREKTFFRRLSSRRIRIRIAP